MSITHTVDNKTHNQHGWENILTDHFRIQMDLQVHSQKQTQATSKLCYSHLHSNKSLADNLTRSVLYTNYLVGVHLQLSRF